MFKKLLFSGSIGEVLVVILLFTFGTASVIQGEINGRGSIYRTRIGAGLINQAPTEKKGLSIQGYFQKANYSSYQKLVNSNIFESDFLVASDSIKTAPTEDVYAFKSKSLKRGFVYSLILPGAGEFYANSKIKAGVFLALEGLFWTGYFTYHNKGVKKRDEYKAFADANWDTTHYRQWLQQHFGVNSDTLKYYDPEKKDSVEFTHRLHSNKDQQYYEMIGKYDQFVGGWHSFWEDTTNFLPPDRSSYLDMRNKSNRFLDRAKYAVMGSLANRVLSAFDAAISVKRYNRKGEGFSDIQMKMRMVEYNNELIPAVSLNMRF